MQELELGEDHLLRSHGIVMSYYVSRRRIRNHAPPASVVLVVDMCMQVGYLEGRESGEEDDEVLGT